MGNVVWSLGKGWHDGPKAKVGLDAKSRLVGTIDVWRVTPEDKDGQYPVAACPED